MINKVDVYYDGWGEHWRWGTLVATTALNGRLMIAFEYSDDARARGLELSSFLMPVNGRRLHTDFPSYQMGLPGPVYDALPDGWGLLLMDRLFKQRGVSPVRVGPLDRLTYIGTRAMGAMSFEPAAQDIKGLNETVLIDQLAGEVEEVLVGEGGAFLQRLLQMGGSPQGARPKVLLYRNPETDVFTTCETAAWEAWLIKFPGNGEHPEVCAIEAVYSACLRHCEIETAETRYFELPNGRTAFATLRFDRRREMRIPMQSLAAFSGANFQLPGTLDYTQFLRATHLCTNDVREKKKAFTRAVFNVAFNNRDDHPKNFAYLMSATGSWTLAPAYDVTYCAGPNGYHQMDIMGEALAINRQHLIRLGVEEAELSEQAAGEVIESICSAAAQFADIANGLLPGQITSDTLAMIQRIIDANVARLR